jgi:hypothetical protein
MKITNKTSGPNRTYQEIGQIWQTMSSKIFMHKPGNTKRGSITVSLTSCLTGLESAVSQLTIFVFICKTD